MEKYLREHYEDEIMDLMNLPNDREHLSIHVDLRRLQQRDFDLFEAMLNDSAVEYRKWDGALLTVQRCIAEEKDAFLEADYQIKEYCHVRFVHLPESRYNQAFPSNDEIGQFVEVKGNVVRMSQAKLLELKRKYACSRCSNTKLVEADYIRMYAFESPSNCTEGNCNGMLQPINDEPVPSYCIDYQEIKIQEPTGSSNMPKSLLVTLENDLVSTCQPGDCVTVCGTINRRWRSFQTDKPCVVIITMRAISLTHEQKRMSIDPKQMMEQMVLMRMEWNELTDQIGELGARDMIVKSICPDVYGIFPVKLAIALAVCSGGIENTTVASPYGHSHRGQSHLLLVGDPGLAKSCLLLSAATFAPRAIHTTGMGCSSAGLTAAAVKEDGEWQLEAGALVLADGGICCIDEFNMMRPTDRASIHEAMEQQTISLAKAGMVCKLSTRCAILAAANPKNLYAMSEPCGPSSLNIGIDSPLLSRFDLVYILRDERNEQWDCRIADHLLELSSHRTGLKRCDEKLWSNEKLQSHFVAVRNIHPQMTDEANEMLGSYYRRCRNDPGRDLGRTTVRLLDSLMRLSQAHARLLFRDRVNSYDAAIVIRLMESTYGFGRILQPFHVITETLPLGPTSADISKVYRALHLDEYRGSDEPIFQSNPIVHNDTDKIDDHIATEQVPSQPLNQSARTELNKNLAFDYENEVGAPNESRSLFADEDVDVHDQLQQIGSNSEFSQPEIQSAHHQHRPKFSNDAISKKTSVSKSMQADPISRPLVSSTIENKNRSPQKMPAFVLNHLLTQADDDGKPSYSARRKISDENAVSPKRKLPVQTIERTNTFTNANVISTNAKIEFSALKKKHNGSTFETINSSEIRTTAEYTEILVDVMSSCAGKRDSESDDDYSCLDFDI